MKAKEVVAMKEYRSEEFMEIAFAELEKTAENYLDHIVVVRHRESGQELH